MFERVELNRMQTELQFESEENTWHRMNWKLADCLLAENVRFPCADDPLLWQVRCRIYEILVLRPDDVPILVEYQFEYNNIHLCRSRTSPKLAAETMCLA